MEVVLSQKSGQKWTLIFANKTVCKRSLGNKNLQFWKTKNLQEHVKAIMNDILMPLLTNAKRRRPTISFIIFWDFLMFY